MVAECRLSSVICAEQMLSNSYPVSSDTHATTGQQ